MAFLLGFGIGFILGCIFCIAVFGYAYEGREIDPSAVFWDNGDGSCLICKKLMEECNCNNREDISI